MANCISSSTAAFHDIGDSVLAQAHFAPDQAVTVALCHGEAGANVLLDQLALKLGGMQCTAYRR
jgi:hypothetical protein